MVASQDMAMRKRQQIASSSKAMFIWVAAASVVVGFAVVIGWFLSQQILFREKVITEKNRTVTILQDNNKATTGLIDNVRVLETNPALNAAKAQPNERALQVVLDALPADANTLALGASLQNRLFGSVANVKIESLSVKQPGDVTGTAVSHGAVQSIGFTAVVTSPDINAIRDVQKKLESSIRTIDIDSLKIEKSDARVTMTLQGHAYYLPERNLTLTDKVVKP